MNHERCFKPMKIAVVAFAFFVLLISCKSNTNEPFDLKTFPKNWVQLTEKGGEFVVFNSCDAGNLMLTIRNDQNDFEILLHGQQEDYLLEILQAFQFKDTIFIETKLKESDERQDFKFFWINKQKGLGRWMTTFSNGQTSNHIFVLKEKQMNLKKVDQPCKECWGEQCDEIELIQAETALKAIEKIFNDYAGFSESTDSQENKNLMERSLKSLTLVTKPIDFELLINVWMYYDPTDFPSRELVFDVLKKNKTGSLIAVKKRIENKTENESQDVSPYSELMNLIRQLEND